jgi:signal transduction histidine kinase
VQLERQVKQRTQQLESAMQQAERATRIKSEFLANMSHEIRTPMNAVLGLSRLLASTTLSLEQQQYVSMIANSGQLLLTIINDILDYSSVTGTCLATVGRDFVILHASDFFA